MSWQHSPKTVKIWIVRGGCSSVVERWLVKPDVAGSSPVSHPQPYSLTFTLKAVNLHPMNDGPERQKLQINEFGATPKSLSEVGTYLEDVSFNPFTHYFEFQVAIGRYPASAGDIRRLLEFPYEFLIHSHRGGLRIETGTEHHVSTDGGYLERAHGLRLHMYTHPLQSLVTTPSFSDVIVSDFADRRTQQVLAHPDGIMVYQAPVYNPVHQKPFMGDVRDLMYLYGKSIGIDLFDSCSRGKNIFDLCDREKVDIQRKFVEETKMIIREARWEEVDELAPILRVINLQDRISSDNPPPASILDTINFKRYGYGRRNFLKNFGGQIDMATYSAGQLSSNQRMRGRWRKFAITSLQDELASKALPDHYKKDLTMLLQAARALRVRLNTN